MPSTRNAALCVRSQPVAYSSESVACGGPVRAIVPDNAKGSCTHGGACAAVIVEGMWTIKQPVTVIDYAHVLRSALKAEAPRVIEVIHVKSNAPVAGVRG